MPDPVPRALIEEIIGLAMRASSSMNTQPWNFYIITGEPLNRIRAGNTERNLAGIPLQPFVNYNLPGGWCLTGSPAITANWKADSDYRWTVPIRGGVGKIWMIGHQAVNTTLQAYWNVVKPDSLHGPDWQLRAQFTLLFPK